ncbi:unnamed protein product [Tilletia controversa]|nr:unnamed protein product [Tilletia controversa]
MSRSQDSYTKRNSAEHNVAGEHHDNQQQQQTQTPPAFPATPVRSHTYYPQTSPTAHRTSKLNTHARAYSTTQPATLQHSTSYIHSADSSLVAHQDTHDVDDQPNDGLNPEERYAATRDQLLVSIQTATSLVNSILTFNDRHPLAIPSDAINTTESTESEGEREGEGEETDDAASTTTTTSDPLSILKVALTLSSNRQNIPSHSLARNTLASLLKDRLQTSSRQLNNLSTRVSDTQSKVLVTGDLNAGKSTFVNALLRKKIMPVDQQPCTTVFCEVLDAEARNGGKEETHVLKKGTEYDPLDVSTYDVKSNDELEQIVADAEDLAPEDAPILKCYALDARDTNASFLRNGLVDIALIDAPGLNRDSIKTTALFARQEEIDVIVFVVSAENHFTLSAREFLQFASNDKAYIYVVVNKYDTIANQGKCRRIVLDQVRLLSPKTYEHHSQLVHFVDSDAVARVLGVSMHDVDVDSVEEELDGSSELKASLDAFAKLESSLRNFVLQKRAVSKLAPAQVYLDRLLADMHTLASFNLDTAKAELRTAQAQLAQLKPKLERLAKHLHALEVALEGEEDELVGEVHRDSERRLVDAVERVGRGQSAVPSEIAMPEWPGLGYVLEYASDVRLALLRSLEAALSQAEEMARTSTADAVLRIQALGRTHRPSESEGIEMQPDQRVFKPENMFARRSRGGAKGGKGQVQQVHGVGLSSASLAGLRLGAEVAEVRPSDLFDAMFHVHVLLGHATGSSSSSSSSSKGKKSITSGNEGEADLTVSLFSTMFFGFGAASVLGGNMFGAKGAIDAVVRIADLMGNRAARRWAGPACAVVSVGLVTYFIWDLPQAIPRNVGRSLKAELMLAQAHAGVESRKRIAGGAPASSTHGGDVGAAVDSALVRYASSNNNNHNLDFITLHTAHLTREVRKVLRQVSWGQIEIFRRASDGLERACKREEKNVEGAREAIEWAGGVEVQARGERQVLRGIEVEKMA